MRNGFTLVELLAVIVILAVLALIATPVVLSIIDDTKESAMLRSAEMYLSGVENAVMRENMNSGGNFRPSDCTILNGTLSCNGTTVEVEVNGEVPKEGTIVFENGKIKEVTLNYESGTIIKDPNGELVYEGSVVEKTLATICTYQDNGVEEKTAGAKYSCEVKPGTSYNFYVLTTPTEGDTTINLIMNANINASGEAVIPGVTSDAGLVAWYANESDSIHGPLTALEYLHNATKSWTNVEPVNYTYKDREVTKLSAPYGGYESFISINGVATITKGDENNTQVTIGSSSEPLRARMLIHSPYDESITEATSISNAPYLYDNLDSSGTIVPIAYWTMTSFTDGSSQAMIVSPYGGGSVVSGGTIDFAKNRGVRPVITLKL